MSVRLQTKWFWIRIPLQSLKLRFTLKRVLDMIITYSQMHLTDKYSHKYCLGVRFWTKWLWVRIPLLPLWHRCFQVNLAKNLRALFITEDLQETASLLCKMHSGLLGEAFSPSCFWKRKFFFSFIWCWESCLNSVYVNGAKLTMNYKSECIFCVFFRAVFNGCIKPSQTKFNLSLT